MDLTRFLVAWRTTTLPDREVVDALVDPAHGEGSAEFTSALAQWPGTYYWSEEPNGRHVILTRATPVSRRERWVVHVALFLATLATTTLAGSVFAGGLTPSGALAVLSGRLSDAGIPALARGLMFSVPLLAILFSHEMGHYLTARRYQLNASPPYFLPVPVPLSPIGTIGAFIRLRTILNDRRQLFDVGIAGPIAGFAVAVPVLWVGLTWSVVGPPGPWGALHVPAGGDGVYALGHSPVTWLLTTLTHPGGGPIALHPTAFAGWLGMFVTMLNLLPMGQLDGGHVLFAAAPGWHRRVAQGVFLVLLVLGWFWPGWLFFGLLVLLLSRGRLVHPPVLDAYRPLPAARRWLAWSAAVLFVLTFAPVPFKL